MLYLPEIESTNTYLLQLLQREDCPDLFTVYTYHQTAGRGQAGNGWESEPNKNLTFTTLFDMHDRAANEQFALSMLVPLAIVRVLQQKCGIEATVKWPNDVYVGDEKICGILIEGVIRGNCITHAIAGVGLNVNQEVFVSNAPNPTSIRLLTGRTYDLDSMMQAVVDEISAMRPMLTDADALRSLYKEHLYRKEGMWWWKEVPVGVAPMMITRTLDDSCFRARIADIDMDGRLVLEDAEGSIHTYHFKQIKYVFA